MKFSVLLVLLCVAGDIVYAGESTLRVASVATTVETFPEEDRSVIFRDEFDVPPDRNPGYVEYNRGEPKGFSHTPDGGLRGGGMTVVFEKDQVEAGSLKVFFGRSPAGNKRLRKDEDFREIYWRVYVKHEAGWEGNPAKLARATCLLTPDWKQGFIAHVWGGKDDCLCIDPATGIVNHQPVTTKYNDFAKLKWLGSRHGKVPIFRTAETGRWVCIESHVRLNSPDKKDGVFELWVDGKLEGTRDDIDWHGTWNDYAINAVFLENYWNDGSVKRQSRWLDHFVIATKPIGPAVAERPVKIALTAAEDSAWEAEIAKNVEGKEIVWRSGKREGGSVTVNGELPVGGTYWVRVRRNGEVEWSPWHSPFR